jgi:hypothetical protein
VPPHKINEKNIFVNSTFVFDALLDEDECLEGRYGEQLEERLKKAGIIPGKEEHIKEAPINFPPTYKHIHKGASYLLNKTYVPCYTDRIFYLTGIKPKGKTIEAKSYQCCYHVNLSDHKPVYGQFVVSENAFEKPMDETVNLGNGSETERIKA